MPHDNDNGDETLIYKQMTNIWIINYDNTGRDVVYMNVDLTTQQVINALKMEGHTFDHVINLPYRIVDFTQIQSPEWPSAARQEEIRRKSAQYEYNSRARCLPR